MKSPRMRVTVGTLLLGLGGCASSAQPQPPGGCEPPDCHINPGPQEATVGTPEPTPDATPQPEPKPQPEPEPEPKPTNGGCEPPDCHINPGPQEDPATPKPEPKPEPKLEPKPEPKPEPKRVNTGPVP